MGINRFYIIIIIRVILITLTCLAFIYIITETIRPATTLFLGILIIIQTGNLIYYVNRTNRELAKFLIYLKEKDTSLAFSTKNIEKTFKGLIQSFDKINREIQDIRIEKEQKHQYLKTIVEHVGTGLISFMESGKVDIINNAAKEILNITHLTDIKQLDRLNPGLSKFIKNLNTNEQKLLKLNINNNVVPIAFKATVFKFGEKYIKLIALQNIKNELSEKELESWQKLTRILRHEIMNSITPITTLTTAIKRSFKKNNKPKPFNEITKENINDTIRSVEVIEERSKGLTKFIDNYKTITSIPKINKSKIILKDLFEKIKLLFIEHLEKVNIKLIISIEPDNITINADEKLLEQVLINLIKNSVESIDKKGIIEISARKDSNISVKIIVSDNGKGISESELENIFIPFYSTKEGGSGIGLSLSQQIIKMHGGDISIRSKENSGTEITILFP
ncbi:MAG: ATP-binding protein [Bacteroidales bacterium]|nr:ATP-binding protein [Bacteroidales bacterium]